MASIPLKIGIRQSALLPGERDTLAALVDCIHPMDDLGPSASQLGTVRYIDSELTGGLSGWLEEYQIGLALINVVSRAIAGSEFATASEHSRQQVLLLIDSAETEPDTLAQLRLFFDLVLEHTYEAVLGDPAYMGNQGGKGWQLVAYPGPRPTVSADTQALDAPVAFDHSSIYNNPLFAQEDPR
jgi:hypothetical protein